jgi:translocation and assembly module TamB
MEVALELSVDDLSWLTTLLPDLRRLSGSLEADLVLGGTPAVPEPRGRLELRGGELRLATDLPAFEAVEADLEFEGRTVQVRRVVAEMGAAPIEATGSVELTGADPLFDLVLKGENVLLARSSGLRARADADLKIVGPLSELVASGRVGLRNSRLRTDIDFLSALQGRGSAPTAQRGLTLFSLREPPLSNMRFDVVLESVEPVQIASNVASGAVRLNLRLTGTGEVPTPQGKIFIDPTRLKLPSGTFLIPSGTITFEEANPFHPRLDLRCEGRRAGYDITLDVSGTVGSPIIEPRSSPPLERQKLLVLVITGRLPPEDLAASGLAATQAVSIYIAKDLLTRWISGDEEPSEESLFERFEFVSGSDVSKSGVLTTEATFRMRRGLLDDNDALYLVAERDVWEDYNMGLRLVFRFP